MHYRLPHTVIKLKYSVAIQSGKLNQLIWYDYLAFLSCKVQLEQFITATLLEI